MSDPDSSSSANPPNPDATLISQPKVEGSTHSSLGPQQQTSSGETRAANPIRIVIDVGSQLGPYKLVDKLGEGGMGAVYKARHVKLGRFVALKVLPPHVMSRPDALSRFEREMLAVGRSIIRTSCRRMMRVSLAGCITCRWSTSKARTCSRW